MNNRAKIFEFLYKNHGNGYNINQIARMLGISVGSAFKVLKSLEKSGNVIANRKNNALFYEVNESGRAKEFYEAIEEKENKKRKKKTKVMCTIGQASDNAVIIKKLADMGMDAARIDASSLNDKAVANIIQNVRKASGDIPILLDISAKPGRSWIKFAVKNDLDFVIVPANSAEDIRQASKLLGYSNIKQVIGNKIKVIAKIDRKSLKNCKEIIEEAYGVVVDRSRFAGAGIEALPKFQKEIIGECSRHGKPSIIAGNILNSSISGKPLMQPEVYDISNAVLEGASCIMLSDETSTGKFPLKSVETLSRIIKNAEIAVEEASKSASHDLTRFIGDAVSELEKILRIDALLIITSGGYSARMISSKRLKCKTIAATSRMKIFRQLHLLWGICPLHVDIDADDISNNDKKEVIMKALKKGFIGKTDQIAIIASIFHSKSKRTNLLEIHNVREFLEYMGKSKFVANPREAK